MPFFDDPQSLTRRSFLATGGSAVAAAAGLSPIAAVSTHAQQSEPPAAGPPSSGNPPGAGQTPPPPITSPRGELLPPLRLEPITAGTEREEEKAPTAAPTDRRLGFAIVGLGRLTLEQILPGFGQAKRCRPVALVSGDRNKALRVAHQYGIKESSVYDYKTFDQLKDNPEVDVIYIVLPNALHAEYTIRGAQAGKHILCEKPMAISGRECEQMIEACRKADKKLMIAYRIQYEPHNRALREMLDRQELGKVKLIDAQNGQNQGGDLKQWRLNKALAGGGSLPDVGLYCLNTIRFLTGEEPIEIGGAHVYSTPGDPRFESVEETVTWMMRFPSGIQATCASSYGLHESRRYRVFGEEAWADMDPAFPYNNIRLRTSRKSPGNPKVEAVTELVLDQKNHFALEMDHMSQCVVENKTPFTPGEEGLQDQRLMEHIYESAHENKVITLPKIDKRDAFRGTPPSPE